MPRFMRLGVGNIGNAEDKEFLRCERVNYLLFPKRSEVRDGAVQATLGSVWCVGTTMALVPVSLPSGCPVTPIVRCNPTNKLPVSTRFL